MSWELGFPFKPVDITVTNYVDPVEIVNVDDDEYEIVELED